MYSLFPAQQGGVECFIKSCTPTFTASLGMNKQTSASTFPSLPLNASHPRGYIIFPHGLQAKRFVSVAFL